MKHRDFAHRLARHIEVVVLSSLSVIAIVASGSIVVVSSSRGVTAEPLLLIVGYAAFGLAFAFRAAALRSRVLVVPWLFRAAGRRRTAWDRRQRLQSGGHHRHWQRQAPLTDPGLRGAVGRACRDTAHGPARA